jgi:hypothetical protein
LLLGWIVCGFYGAALAIRPVGWIIGPKATGKSTLQTAIADMLGGWIVSELDPTPAAIWQTLGYDCLPIGIDEAEATDDKDGHRRLNELVRLARMCFSGGRLPRGGSDDSPTITLGVCGHLFSNTDDQAAQIMERAFGRIAAD